MTSRAANASPERRADTSDGWMLQADAAAAAGCSVSVIRKWRRLGAIAERTRTSAGGMKRIEVRLADVLLKMEDSMPERLVPPDPPPMITPAPAPPDEQSPAPSPEGGLRPSELEVFVRHIAEAERRAAVAEAQLQANEVMTRLLRERIETLQAQLDASASGQSVSQSLAGLVNEIRQFRKQFEELERDGVRHDAQERIRARQTHDAALLSLCAAAGIRTRFKLGATLTPTERARLTKSLADVGLDVIL